MGGDEKRLVHGEKTEDALRDAGIETADVLIAGTSVDAINLGVTTVARRIHPGIVVVIRQNHVQDHALITAAHANMAFVQSNLMVHECLQILKTPMLGRFIGHLRAAGPEFAATTIARARERSGDGAPLAWTFACDVMQPGMFGAFFQRPGDPLRIGHLVADPTDPSERLAATALLLERQGEPQLLPDDGTELKPGDRILFVGKDSARRLQLRYLNEPGTVAWVCSGREPPRGLVFRWWQEHSRSA